MNKQRNTFPTSHKNSKRALFKRESESLSVHEEPITKVSIREAMLSSLIRQSNNASIDSDGSEEDGTFDESELKGSKVLDLTTEEHTKFFESQFTHKMDFTPAQDKVDGWRFLAQQILNPISSWQNALNKLKERKRVNMLMKSKLPPVAYLKQSFVMTSGDSPLRNGRRKSLSPCGPNEFGIKTNQISYTRRGATQLIPVPDHMIRTFQSEEKFGTKVLELENQLEELEEDHEHAMRIFKSMQREAAKLLKGDMRNSYSPLSSKYALERAQIRNSYEVRTPEPRCTAADGFNPLSTFYTSKKKIEEPKIGETIPKGQSHVLLKQKGELLNSSRLPSPLLKRGHVKGKKSVNAKNFITLNRNVKASRTGSPKAKEVKKNEAEYKDFLEGENIKKTEKASGQKPDHRKLPSVSQLRKKIPKIYGRAHRKHRISIDCQKYQGGSKSACKLYHVRGGNHDLEVTPLAKVRNIRTQTRRFTPFLSSQGLNPKLELETHLDRFLKNFQTVLSQRCQSAPRSDLLLK